MSGRFIIFCAGASSGSVPAGHVYGYLVNVPESGHNLQAIAQTTKFFRSLPPGTLIQLDSGGFQLYLAEYGKVRKTVIFAPNNKSIYFNSNINLTPQHVIATVRHLMPYVFIMVALDMPVPRASGKARREILFMKSNTFNVRCAREIAALRESHKIPVQLFIPCQTYDLSQFEYFIKELGDIRYDGFSLPTRIFNTKKITVFILKFIKMGVRQFHVLGTTRFSVLALLNYVARNYFDFVSVDATSWRKFAEKQVYLNPFTLIGRRLHDKAILVKNDVVNCLCPFCSGMSFGKIKNLPNPDKTRFLMSHNFWVLQQASDEFYQHAETPLMLRNFMLSKVGRKKENDIALVYRCITTIDAAINILSDDLIRIIEKDLCGAELK